MCTVNNIKAVITRLQHYKLFATHLALKLSHYVLAQNCLLYPPSQTTNSKKITVIYISVNNYSEFQTHFFWLDLFIRLLFLLHLTHAETFT